MLPSALAEGGFVDDTPHRRELPPTYNEYRRIDRDPPYDEAYADAWLALRPLFSLGFFLADWLDEQAFFGAQRVIVSSGSSKTAVALAEQLRGRVERIGLTSPLRRDLVERGKHFERVIAYDEIDDEFLPDGEPRNIRRCCGRPGNPRRRPPAARLNACAKHPGRNDARRPRGARGRGDG